MGEHTRSARSDAPTAQRSSAPVTRIPAPLVRPSVSGALALQRAIGNRATGRILSRWAAHPVPEKKGILMTDGAVADYNRFNPPLNK
jgi:hypothetical protein